MTPEAGSPIVAALMLWMSVSAHAAIIEISIEIW